MIDGTTLSRVAAAVAAAGTVWLATTPLRRETLVAALERYRVEPPERGARAPTFPILLRSGLTWSTTELRVRQVAAIAGGSVLGAMLGQGRLFITGATRSTATLMALGAVAGYLAISAWLTSRGEQRYRQAMIEIPTVTDAIALQILAGDSVDSAIRNTADGDGVVAMELRAALDATGSGFTLSNALRALGPHSASADASRLYGFLADAHQSGGRVHEGLGLLAIDFRAEHERRLVAEGGKRAVAVYAPILALMVPVTLLFLLYPMLAGLRDLAVQ